ncbi:MAG: 2-keto-3-deoxygluconate permease [Spirochaetes bacterium ADurb.Bin315]|nr:MAG: 2-keto-3-deoxygluconate permease [Spirochaetes bacterium ADurb.Bin315]HOE89138.1 2-keto-3-deoxygluconate permease [Sphaerochaeta sp.]HOR80679.1 2-keto-3-deoxygluconate permease [Sphaerochaeta sp.]
MKMGKVPILDTINKIPGGLMVVPLVLGVLTNTFFPGVLNIGSFTTAFFKNGALTLIALLFLCSGAQINLKTAGVAVYKGVVLNTSKVLFGVFLGVIFAKVAGPQAAFLGVTPLAMISAMSNSNGGLYTALASKYGDESDVGAIAIISSNDGPFFEMMFMGIAGVANIPIVALIAVIVPIIVGMILGNLDEKFREFLKPGMFIAIFTFSFPLGAGLSLQTLGQAGLPGILLGLLTLLITGVPSYFVYRLLIPKRMRVTSAVGAGVGTTAGNALATPAAIALVDPAWAPYVDKATIQVAASIVVTAILVPFLVDFFYKYELKRGLVTRPIADIGGKIEDLGEQL